MKPIHVAAVVPAATMLKVHLRQEDAAALRDLATRVRTSPANLVQVAVRNMLDQEREGTLPAMPDFETADFTMNPPEWRNQAALTPGQKPN